jgi:hypothetical protein
MKVLMVAITILALTFAAGAREIDGAYVSLTSPAPLDIVPATVMTFIFWVQNDSGDAEWLSNIHITFPDGFNLVEGSMGFAEIATGRPSFDMTVSGQTAQWDDNDGGYGEIYSTEGTEVWVDAFVPGCYECGELYWELWGDVWGAEPHYVDGVIDLCPSPVEESTWGSIKALYR